MATGEQKNLTDCYWFLQNQCIKGEDCEYRHCQAALENTSNCKFWIEGKCTNQNCKFRHPSGVHTTKDRSQTICIYYSQGKCTKGEACPFSHSGAPAAVSDLEQKKKEEEEELKRLQMERKREEERLARLKAEGERIEKQTKKKVSPAKLQQVERKTVKENPDKRRKSDGVGTFVKSFDLIIKQKEQQEEIDNQNVSPVVGKRLQQKKAESQKKKAEPQKKKAEKPAKKNSNQSEPKEKKTSQPSGPANFGIKTLDQIIQEKQGETSVEVNTQESASKSTAIPASPYVEEIRKKNQQKFGASTPSVATSNSEISAPATKQTSTPATKQTSTPATKQTSPKRKSEVESSKVGQQTEIKRQKLERQSPKITANSVVKKTPPVASLKKSTSVTDLDDFDKELADLGVDIAGTEDSLEVDEDFEKEMNDLMST